jgi:hypothetical protein
VVTLLLPTTVADDVPFNAVDFDHVNVIATPEGALASTSSGV